ncbi:MAG: hypothetical protein OEY23_17960, partial [Acidimicrobiia bacterium]|nr:hypothetical protein [Acidimicrobiia bacterium]
DIQLQSLRRRLADRRIDLHVDDDAKALLVTKGYEPAFGARPLKRVIQRELGDALAIALLEGKYSEGDTVTVGTDHAGSLVLG